MKPIEEYKKVFVRQHGDFSCGLACLSTIIRYYGGDIKQEDLRSISGTTIQGTTLLGLYQAAEKVYLKPEGYSASIEDLKKLEHPTILHVIKNKNQQHFIVCFGCEKDKFIVADPAWGVLAMSADELEAIWQSKTLLLLKPTDKFVKTESDKRNKLRWFQSMLKDDYPLLITAFVLGTLISILGLTTAVFSQKLIDDLLPSKDFERIGIGIALFFVLLLFRSGLEYLRNIFIARQGRDFNNRLVDKFFSKILFLTKSFFDSIKTGEIVARMNDSRRIQQTISYTVSSAMIDILILIISIIFLLVYSWKMALMALVCIPFYVLLVAGYNHRIVEKQREVMVTYALTESTFIDHIQGVDEIKNANKQPVFKSMINGIYGLFQNSSYNLGVLGAKYGMLAQMISTTITVGIILSGIYFVLNDELKLGELMAIISISGLIISSTANLSIVNIRLQEAGVAFNRYYECIKAEAEPDENEGKQMIDKTGNVRLEINHLSFRFIGRKKLFDDVSLYVEKGEIAMLLGEVGSGKSTLVRILQRNYLSESGEILLNGQPISDLSLQTWRSHIGVVSQTVKVFNGTVGENICLGNLEAEKEVLVDFLREYGFEDFINNLPQGLYTLVGEDGINLSGGQQQLVALARALYRQPILLLLDEPTSSMDSKTETFVMDLIKRKAEQFATLLVTHRSHLAEYADRVYVFEGQSIQIRK